MESNHHPTDTHVCLYRHAAFSHSASVGRRTQTLRVWKPKGLGELEGLVAATTRNTFAPHPNYIRHWMTRFTSGYLPILPMLWRRCACCLHVKKILGVGDGNASNFKFGDEDAVDRLTIILPVSAHPKNSPDGIVIHSGFAVRHCPITRTRSR